MEKTKTNPLAHLAWLGLLGVVGIISFSPALLVFLLFFFFLAYKNMPADELFWENIRKAASKAFAVYIGYATIAILLLFILTLYSLSNYPAQIDLELYDHTVIYDMFVSFSKSILWAFVVGYVLSLCVFFFTLIRINRREKRFLEDSVADTIDMAVTADDNN